MKRFRGFRLKHRVATLFRFRTLSGYHRFDPQATQCSRPFWRFFSCIKTKVKSLCPAIPGGAHPCGFGRGYLPLDDERPPAVPKGHMAVYVVGKDGGEYHRVLVPVIYFNHPLFGALLREAEEEFGFNHPGGITVPCQISEFESVQTRIAAAAAPRGGRRLLAWKKAC
ncbi:hypothetical protein NMG60_11023042 [Bertholletia excelsa]